MSLFVFISEVKLKQTTAKFPLARHDTCHVKESFKTRLRYVNMTYSDAIIIDLREKKFHL